MARNSKLCSANVHAEINISILYIALENYLSICVGLSRPLAPLYYNYDHEFRSQDRGIRHNYISYHDTYVTINGQNG